MDDLELFYFDHRENNPTESSTINLSGFFHSRSIEETIYHQGEESLFSERQPVRDGSAPRTAAPRTQRLWAGELETERPGTGRPESPETGRPQTPEAERPETGRTGTQRPKTGRLERPETERPQRPEAGRPETTSLACKGEGDPALWEHTSQSSRSSFSELHMDELSMLCDDDLGSDESEKSADYGFIIAVTCLVTGISLVAVSYTVPRDVDMDPDSVSAREMERLEGEKARVGAHLDRCVIAGLCLLTLGGVLLSMLLMVSMWKGEVFRRKAFAYSKHAANLYGSISLRGGSSPIHSPAAHLSVGDEDLEVLS